MDETRRASRGKGERRIGAATRLHAPRFLRSNLHVSNLKSRIPGLISTRQCCRIESSATHSKQRIGAQATRQFFGDSTRIAVPSESAMADEPRGWPDFRVSTFDFRILLPRKGCQPKPGVCQRNLFKTNGRRTQQVSIFCDDHPDRIVILPTGHAVDYDAARSADRLRCARLGEIARHGGRLTVCGSSPSTDRKMDGLRGSQKQIPRRPNYGLARDDNETGHNGILNFGRFSFTELKEERDGHSHPGSTAC